VHSFGGYRAGYREDEGKKHKAFHCLLWMPYREFGFPATKIDAVIAEVLTMSKPYRLTRTWGWLCHKKNLGLSLEREEEYQESRWTKTSAKSVEDVPSSQEPSASVETSSLSLSSFLFVGRITTNVKGTTANNKIPRYSQAASLPVHQEAKARREPKIAKGACITVPRL
jgi:hypothetical protein